VLYQERECSMVSIFMSFFCERFC